MTQAAHRRPSSKDVALAAGVSRTTVSFVLNDRPDMAIPESTRRRVWDAARELGYSPSPEARALRFGRSAIVLCLLPDWPIGGPFGVLLEELSNELADAGLIMLSHQRRAGEDLGQALAALTPTAIVSMCDLSQDEVDLLARRGIDLTTFMGRVPGSPDVASFSQGGIGALQVQALVELGHSVLTYVSPHDRALDWFSAPRLEGARREARRLGARLTHFRVPKNDHPPIGDWLSQPKSKNVTGICAYNDEVAFSLLMAASDQGIAVPDDVSVIGVDDSSIGKLTRPTLSTIGFRLTQEALRVAGIVTGQVEQLPSSPVVEVLDLKLRGSVKQP